VNIIDKNLLNSIANNLEILANQVRNTAPTGQARVQSFDLDNLSVESQKPFLDELLKWERSCPDSSYIYVISAMDGVDLSDCNTAFASAKSDSIDAPQRRAFARTNNRESSTLYVGSSRSIKKRIAEHLGFGSRSTYALQISHWASKLDGQFMITIYRFDGGQNNVIQAIEDGLWERLKPMFGRQGSK